MTDVTANSQSVSLSRYPTVLRRRRWVAVLGILMGVAAGVGYLNTVPPKWTAATQVNITVISDDPFNAQRSPSDLIDPQTELQTAKSSSALNQAVHSLGGAKTATDLRQQMDATLLDNGTVMRISFKADSASEARLGADAIASAYLDFRSAQADDRRDTIRRQLDARREQLRSDIQKANKTIKQGPAGAPAVSKAEADLQVLVAEANSLATQITSLEGLDTSGGSVLTDAADNPITVTPRRALTLGTGLGLGLVFGMLLAFLVNVLDRRVHDGFDVLGASAGPLVGTVSAEQATIPAEGSDWDAIAMARERLLADFDPEGGILAVLDLTHGERPSDLPVNLAIALAESHGDVDLALPGWTIEQVSLLLGALGVERLEPDGSAAVPELGLRLFTQVDLDRQSRGRRMTTLGDIVGHSDADRCLVIAVPPVASRAVHLAAARLADSTLFVAETLATRIGELARQASDVQAVHARLSGTVLAGRLRTVDYESVSGARAGRDTKTSAEDEGPPSEGRDPDDESSAMPEASDAERPEEPRSAAGAHSGPTGEAGVHLASTEGPFDDLGHVDAPEPSTDVVALDEQEWDYRDWDEGAWETAPLPEPRDDPAEAGTDAAQQLPGPSGEPSGKVAPLPGARNLGGRSGRSRGSRRRG